MLKNVLIVSSESKQDKNGKLYIAILTDEGETFTAFEPDAYRALIKSERAIAEIEYVLSGQWKNITKSKILARLAPKIEGYNAEDKRNRLGCLTNAKDLFITAELDQGENMAAKVIETAEAFFKFVQGTSATVEAEELAKGE